MKWNKKYAGVMVMAVIGAVCVCGISYRVSGDDAKETHTTVEQKVEWSEGQNGFSEDGTTQIKTESQLPEFSVEAVEMIVEEVYVEAGESVEEGTALFKVTEESMEAAIAYYEEAIDDAQNALDTAQLELSNGTLEAESELQDSKLAADTAQSTYDAALAELTIQIDEKKEAYEVAVEEIIEYQNALDGGAYYTQVGIDEKQATVDAAGVTVVDTQTALATAQSAYDIAQKTMLTDIENLKSQIAAGASYETLQVLAEQVSVDYTNAQTAATDLSQKQIAADTAQTALEKAILTQENALKEYDMLVAKANEKIEELSSSLETLREEYEQAERDSVTAQAMIQKEYEEAVLAGKYAGTEYESRLAELAEAVENAQVTLDELLEEQGALAALEDGVVCADRTGTVASVAYEAEDVLVSGVALATYYDTDTIYVSVEVAQEQIALLAVGDAVDVSVTGNREMVSGTIASIATEKTSGGSISNVTYTVVIAIDNTEGRLSSGSSATVMFDYEEDITEGAE